MGPTNPKATQSANEGQPQIGDGEEDYHSSSDEDFNPEATKADVDLSESGEEDDNAASQSLAPKGKRKQHQIRQNGEEEDAEADWANSGDEAIVRRAKRRKGRQPGINDGDDEEDEAGREGGLVKTRAQRAKE